VRVNPSQITPSASPANVNAGTVTAPTAGVLQGQTLAINPSQITPSAPPANVNGGTITAPAAQGQTVGVNPSQLTSSASPANVNAGTVTAPAVAQGQTVGVGNGAPSVNLGRDRANVSGNTGSENLSGINPVARGASGGNVGPNLNVGPNGAPPIQGRAGSGSGNASGVVPAARGPAAGGVPPSGGGPFLATNTVTGTPSPPALGQSAPVAPTVNPAVSASALKARQAAIRDSVQGISSAQNQTFSRTGLAKPAEDGISTKIVPAQPCTSAARETDGTTTCVGIPR
jgi:hypothetical protein